MPESFEEIVQFKWEVSNPEEQAKKMVAALDSVDQKLNQLVTSAQSTWTKVAGSMLPALESAQLLIEKYTALIALQQQLANAPTATTPGVIAGNAPGGYNVTPGGVQAYRGGPFVTQSTLPDDVKEYVRQYKENLQIELGRQPPNTGGGGGKPDFRFTTEDWAKQGYFQGQSNAPLLPSDVSQNISLLGTSSGEAAQSLIALGTSAQTLSAGISASVPLLAGATNLGLSSPVNTGWTTPGEPWMWDRFRPAGLLNAPSPELIFPSAGGGGSRGGGVGGPTIFADYSGGYYGRGGSRETPPLFNGMTEEELLRMQRGTVAVRSLGQEFQNVNEPASQFELTLGRIARYAVIFGAFQAVSTTIKGVVDEMIRLEDVSARVGFITGASQGQIQQQFTQAARYGISPEQAGPGIIAAAQLGLSPESQEIARRLSVVAGPEQYAEILDEVNELQERANSLGIENVNILGFMAESWKTIQGSVTDYSNALNAGMQTGAALGLQAEQAGLAIERVVRASGKNVEFVGNLAQSTIDKLQDPKIQEELEKRFGITPTEDTGALVLQIADLQAQLGAAGNQRAVGDISGVIQGGLAGPQRTRELPLLFQEWAKAIREGNKELADFGELEDRVLDSATVKINQMTAAWRLFLQSVGNTGPFKDVLSSITDILNFYTTNNQAVTALQQLSPEERQNLYKQYEERTGRQLTEVYSPEEGVTPRVTITDQLLKENNVAWYDLIKVFELQIKLDTEARIALLAQLNSIPGSGLSDHIIGGQLGYRGNQLPEPPSGRKIRPISGVPEVQFGGFNTLDKDAGYTLEELQSLANKFDALIAKPVSEGGAGQKVDRVVQVYYDETTGLMRNIYASTAATAYATEALRKMQQEQITGTFNVPDGGRSVAVLFNALTAGFRPKYPGGGIGGDTGPVYVTDTPEQRQRDNVLVRTLETLDASTRGVLGYLQAHGAAVDPDDPYGSRRPGSRPLASLPQSVPTAGEQGIRDYIRAHSSNPDTLSVNDIYPNLRDRIFGSGRRIDPSRRTQQEHEEPLYPRENPFMSDDYMERTRDKPLLRRPGGRQIGTTEARGGATRQVSNAININNRILVQIDGRLLASYMNRKTYREFENIRNSNSNGPNTTGMVG